jgi:hypothetical protein
MVPRDKPWEDLRNPLKAGMVDALEDDAWSNRTEIGQELISVDDAGFGKRIDELSSMLTKSQRQT